MGAYKNHCPNCGDGVDSERWNAGYEYCKKKECFDMLGRKKGVTMFDHPPKPGEVDLHPLELDEIEGQYQDQD